MSALASLGRRTVGLVVAAACCGPALAQPAGAPPSAPRAFLDALRIENAVQVVALVLHDAGVEITDRPVDRPTQRVAPDIAQPSMARHEPTEPRNAQAAFPSRFALVAQELDRGVDEHRQRHGLGIGVPRVVLELEDDDPLQDADLNRREARTAVGAHRVEHVVHELVQARRIEFRHRRRGLAQQRVT